MSTDRKWIRLSGAGEFRGEGKWQEVRGEAMHVDWDQCSRTFFLPVAREFKGRLKTEDKQGPCKYPHFVVEGGWLIHQFHEVGVKIMGGDPRSLEFAQKQIQSLLEQVLIIEGETSDPEA